MPSVPPFASNRLDDFGLDAVCEIIADGGTMTAVAKKLEVSFGTLSNWIARDDERSARVTEARRTAARFWDEKAEARIDEAPDAFELARAKELAFHYRWRSSKIAPLEYGDKIDVRHSGSIALPVPLDTSELSDEQREAIHAALLSTPPAEEPT